MSKIEMSFYSRKNAKKNVKKIQTLCKVVKKLLKMLLCSPKKKAKHWKNLQKTGKILKKSFNISFYSNKIWNKNKRNFKNHIKYFKKVLQHLCLFTAQKMLNAEKKIIKTV